MLFSSIENDIIANRAFLSKTYIFYNTQISRIGLYTFKIKDRCETISSSKNGKIDIKSLDLKGIERLLSIQEPEYKALHFSVSLQENVRSFTEINTIPKRTRKTGFCCHIHSS